MAGEQPITFVWGPPGTGKTTTLVNVALQFLSQGKRVLMLSYSNVSVDGALWRMASHFDNPGGMIVRYGYPRMKDVLDSKVLTSYAYIIHTHPEIEKEYEALKKEKKSLNKKDPRRREVDKRIKKIRTELKEQEQELVQKAPFVATTVSKAIVDRAVYSQSFDLVIFDEASMAYVPQIVFSASLAKESFLCLGDFKQLPAIVQNPEDTVLRKDIFEFTGIRKAVTNGYGHKWLVMLDKQYRMHPDIAEFVGERMYEGLLWSENSVYGRRQPVSDIMPLQRRPMGMIDLSGSYSVCIKTNDGSRINLLSAMTCIRLAEMMHSQYEVGIITPYSAQSRLILAMIRDLQEVDGQYKTMSSATVHQFQGSEKPVIIYDAVDCFRMPYPGVLLTAKRDDVANRLFNVALTRTQGKFILVANKDYMFQKKIAKDLLFTQLMKEITGKEDVVSGEDLLYEIGTTKEKPANVFYGERDEVDSWEFYLEDIQKARDSIVIDLPGPMDDDADAVSSLIDELKNAESRQVQIYIRVGDNVSVPQGILKYCQPYTYVTTPFTIIDSRVVWFGEPLCSADFMSEGNVILTEFFPCLRFEGKYAARLLKAFYGISGLAKREEA